MKMSVSEGWETTDPKSLRRPQNAVCPGSIVRILAPPCAQKPSTTIQEYKEDPLPGIGI